MTELIQQAPQLFVGKVYTPVDSDEMGTFSPAWQDFEAGGYFDQLDAIAETPNRTIMLVFSPYGNIQYWIGSLLPVGTETPADLEVFQLPETTVGSVTKPSRMMMNVYPLQTTFNNGLGELEKAGFPLPSHIGQTDHPYYLESYKLKDGDVDTVEYRLYINPDQLEGYDDYD